MNLSQSGYEMFFRSVQRKLLFIIFHLLFFSGETGPFDAPVGTVVDIVVSIVHVLMQSFFLNFFSGETGPFDAPVGTVVDAIS